MEDNEDAESTKSEVKLGKLQFALDYDFQKGEVCMWNVIKIREMLYVFCNRSVWALKSSKEWFTWLR